MGRFGLLMGCVLGLSAGGCTVIFDASETGDPDPNTGTHHVLLRTQDGEGGIYYGCSDAVEFDAWNHVAVSFDSDGTTLFVNGELADNTRAVVPDDSILGQHACGDGNNSALTFAANDRDFLWGASNISASEGDQGENKARDGTTGLLDELRFRDVPFTPNDAVRVHSSLGAMQDVCGAPLNDTIAYFTVDADDMQETLTDSRPNASTQTVAESIEKVSNDLLTRAPLNTKSREGDCGLAVELTGVTNGTFVRIGNAYLRETVSMDFWFNTESIGNNGSLGGLLVADGQGNEKADMGIYIFRSDPKL